MALNLFRIKESVTEGNYEEAVLYLSPDGHNFIFVYKIQGKYFAQIEDKAYGGYDLITDVTFRKNGKNFLFKSSHFSMKLGLIKDENQDYLNVNGMIAGPYTKIRKFHFNDNPTFYLWYELIGKTFVLINNTKYGEYKAVYNVYLSPEGTSFAILYKEGSLHYIKTEEDITEGYEEVKDFQIDYETKYSGFIYKKENGEWFVKINSTILGPFESCSDLIYHKEVGAYFFSYKQQGANYIQINNSVLGGYESYSVLLINKNITIVSSAKQKENYYHFIVNGIGAFNDVKEYALSEDQENYIFAYSKLGMEYIVTSDFEFGPYNSVSNLSISKNGQNYCFIFRKQYDNCYVNINGEIYGPYVSVSEVKIGNSASNFGFIYNKNAKFLVNISNSVHGMYESASNLVISDNGSGYSYRFSKRTKTGPFFAQLQDYLSLNGEILESNIMITDYLINTTSIEAIVFRKKEGMFINLNDTEFGPFYSISECRFLPDDTMFAFKFKEAQNEPEHLQINGKKYYSRNKNNTIYSPIFSNDKKQFAFIHYSQHDYYIQITDQTFGPYDLAFFPSFSPDNKIFIYKFEKDQGTYLNINGMVLGPFGKAEYTFSDGKLYICYLQDDMIFIDEITW